MPFFAFHCIGMQKMASFSLTGKIRAPPRRAANFFEIEDAKMISFSLTPILRIELAPRRGERQICKKIFSYL